MKIVKLAQGGPPPKHVRVRFTFKRGQAVDVRIVAHGPNSSCAQEDDASLLKDLLEAEVPGFDTPEIEGGGKTAEGMRPVKPMSTPPTKTSPFGEEPEKVRKPTEKKLDMGYGV